VIPLARAGVAVGADGVIVEVHPQPERALSDGPQALLPAMFLEMCEELRQIHSIVRHYDTALV
jgi:3-deoxy-7-phosphoheptulonate synthase